MLFTMVEALEAAKAPLQHVYFSQGIKYYVRAPTLGTALPQCCCARSQGTAHVPTLPGRLELALRPGQPERLTRRLPDADASSHIFCVRAEQGSIIGMRGPQGIHLTTENIKTPFREDDPR